MVNLNNVQTLLLNNGYTLKSTYNGNGITNHVYVSGCGVFEIELVSYGEGEYSVLLTNLVWGSTIPCYNIPLNDVYNVVLNMVNLVNSYNAYQ